MSHNSHDLRAEFPDDQDHIHELKLRDTHFRHLAQRYEDVNHEISRIESGLDAASDERVEDLKKVRLSTLDEISQVIAATKAA